MLFLTCDLNAFPFVAHNLVYLHKVLHSPGWSHIEVAV